MTADVPAFDLQRTIQRIWSKDPSVWKSDPGLAATIKNRLGWLSVVSAMQAQANDLLTFAEEIKRAGFLHVVLLGMGGSSLAPEVFAQTFGSAPGYPTLHVLDSTDPATVRAVERGLDLSKTLFVCSSKSGTTIETSSLYQNFSLKLQALYGKQGPLVGTQCVAITDPGTPLERLAREAQFRRVFLAPPDVGGRFSALTVFGLAPAALIGVDLRTLLQRAQAMAQACSASVPPQDNPGISFGARLGELAKAGRDKLTLVLSPAIASFGAWVEQLIAESTGKESQGIIPIDNEPLGDPEVYGQDRVFVTIQLTNRHGGPHSPDEEDNDTKLRQLEAAGHPVIRITLHDAFDLGGEFFRWELATVVAGAILGINPFDEPNVTESKENTQRLLDQVRSTGRLPEGTPLVRSGGLSLFGALPAARRISSLPTALATYLEQVRPGDYIAIMAYFQRTTEHFHALQAIRRTLRDRFHVATTVGYGPRFLHSTGQLHKGGPNTGVALQITVDDPEDLPVPGTPYTFGLLKRAQALGDFLALKARGRRVMRIHLGAEALEVNLQEIVTMVELAAAAKTVRKEPY